jgi:hypothetical protein
MAQNIYRRDKLANILQLIPSKNEIVTIEDYTKHGFMYYGQLRVIAQLLEKGEGIEVRDWDTNFGKGNAGLKSLDLSISKVKFGTGATGDYSSTFGLDTKASGKSSHAEGDNSQAVGQSSHAEGDNSQAVGKSSHAEGSNSHALGEHSHVEGINSSAIGDDSHAEGSGTAAFGDNSHSEGNITVASGDNSHSEGNRTTASGDSSHAGGSGTKASGDSSFVNGIQSTASGKASTALGKSTVASGENSIATGEGTIASGKNSIAMGKNSSAVGEGSVSIGTQTSSGYPKELLNKIFQVEIDFNQRIKTEYKTGMGYQSQIIALEAGETIYFAMATGEFNNPNVVDSMIYVFDAQYNPLQEEHYSDYIADADNDNADGYWSERGSYTNNDTQEKEIFIIFGGCCDIESNFTTIGSTVYFAISKDFEIDFDTDITEVEVDFGDPLQNVQYSAYNFSEGYKTFASGEVSHAEGESTIASGNVSHAEGSTTTASGNVSHAEGSTTTASGFSSHAEGNKTIAKNHSSHAAGKYNIGTSDDTIHETGIGTSDTDRKNAFEIYLNGILRSPEANASDIFNELKALVTTEFVKEKVSIENWFSDFTYSSGNIFRSNIPSTDKHANISAVFLDGIMVRPSKYSMIINNGYKAI